MRLAIIIASTTRASARRARVAYLRESPPSTPIIVSYDRSNFQRAWERGLTRVGDEFDWIHFGAEHLEPHPGWWQAARADGHRIVAPVLWTADGTPPEETRDWTPAKESSFPTMTRRQIERFGLPPFDERSSAEFVLRSQYAFTAV